MFYVIFIYKHDKFGKGLPIYRVERVVFETGEAFDDGSHIVYVNGKYKGDDEIGKLIQDFYSTSPDDMPLIRIRDVKEGKTSTFYNGDYPKDYIIHKGEYLIGMDGEFNISPWQSEDALLNQRVCYICSSSDALLNDYLFYYLPDPLKKINDATPSVTVKHLSTKTLGKTSIPLPPLPEQQRIVSRIESLFSKLDEAKCYAAN